MDTAEAMSKSSLSASGPGGALALFTPRDTDIPRKAAKLTYTFLSTLKVAEIWITVLKRTHTYFTRVKRVLRKHARLDSFSAFEPGRTRHILQAIVEQSDEQKSLEDVYGPLPEDIEMPDADNLNAIRDELTWSAINAAQAAQQAAANAGASTGTSPVQPHQQVSPYPQHYQAPPQFPQSSSRHHADPMAKPIDHIRNPSTSAANQGQSDASNAAPAAPVASSVMWNQEQAEEWLTGLEQKFQAQDLAAFTEGADEKEWIAMGGWVGEIWTRKVAP
jgi:ribosomal protein L31